MSEEPRRSGRATKGVHKNASSSPAPNPKPVKTSKSKPAKKSIGTADDGDDDDDGDIRCICGNNNPKDKRAFIGCDACTVWQHNVCMGVTDDEDGVPEHYFCEDCKPDEHTETLQALQRGEKIWEARNKIYQNEKKMSKNRKTSRQSGDDATPGWLRKEVGTVDEDAAAEVEQSAGEAGDGAESSSKRKREDGEDEQVPSRSEVDDKAVRGSRQDKRRKSAAVEIKAELDPSTALVDISQLPPDRQKIAQALGRIIKDDIVQRSKSGFRVPEGESARSLGDYYAVRIEYALSMNHGNSREQAYLQQFRALHANLKQNAALIDRLVNSSLTADDLATMSTSEMASEELQRSRTIMKEALDRQAVAVPEDGPRYKQDHKGYQLIEDENEQVRPDAASERRTDAAQASASHPSDTDDVVSGSSAMEVDQPAPAADGSRPVDGGHRRSSTQQFDMSNIWAKTAQQSPVSTAPQAVTRPLQAAPRRPSASQSGVIKPDGAKEDPEIDRLLDDNDEVYSPAEATGPDAIVWRGKLQQSSEESAPTVNARFAAGRDLAPTIAWRDLFPSALSIDGRLQTAKAEEYLCGLRWSASSDVCVLTLTPYDNLEAFNAVFDYFHSRKRYAVVAEGKPAMVKDLYIIPVEAGGDLPDHVDMLEHCTIKKPTDERLMLMTLVVARSPDSPPVPPDGTPSQAQSTTNGNLPHHVRRSFSGPAGSPLNTQNPVFASPAGPGYGAPGGFPPSPYGPPPPAPPAYAQPPAQQPHPDPRVNHILGSLQYAPAIQQILGGSTGQLDDNKLYHLRKIVTEDPKTMHDVALIAKALGITG